METWAALVSIGAVVVALIAWLAKVGHQVSINERNINLLFERQASLETRIMDELVKVGKDVSEVKGFLSSIRDK